MKPCRAEKVVRLPVDPKDRRMRQLAALWAEEDRLERQQRALRARIRPLQLEVSRDRGFIGPSSRETIERSLLRKTEGRG